SILYENFILKKGIQIKKQKELADMYEESRKLASELGLDPYYMYRQKNMVGNMENLGYSKKGKECIYNIQMIEDKQTIIALGADAVSKVVFLNEDRIERFGNAKDIKEYVNRIDEMIEGKINLLNSLYK
ncbi:MAG: coproporphyrinogen dehydrogenase HemZ, partial [Clostridium sp.]|nr:coproporphyrinogen dehydrogenase HemZ [Clostridium sp.]